MRSFPIPNLDKKISFSLICFLLVGCGPSETERTATTVSRELDQLMKFQRSLTRIQRMLKPTTTADLPTRRKATCTNIESGTNNGGTSGL